jgi:predicted PurR-regulated permease PerM
MTPTDSPRRISWRAADVVRAAVLVLAVYVVARVLYAAHILVFITFLGLLFGLAVSSGADQLQRFRIPRSVSAAGIVLGFIGLLVLFGVWTGPTIQTQYRELREKLPQAFIQLDQWIAERQGGILGAILLSNSDSEETEEAPPPQNGKVIRPSRDLATESSQEQDTIAIVGPQTDSLSHIKSIGTSILNQMAGAKRYVFPVITSTFAAVTGIVLVLFLAIYIAVNPTIYRNGILALVPNHRRARWEEVLSASGTALRKWLITQLIAMVVIGVVTTIVLMVLNVPAALPLGILAGLLEFVPTIGPILSAIPSIAMGFTDSPEKAAIVAVAYILIQFIENHLLIPILMKEGVDLPPVLTILFQAIMAFLFGFMGLFVAVPMLVLAMVFIKMLYIEDVIGHDRRMGTADSPPPSPPPVDPPTASPPPAPAT